MYEGKIGFRIYQIQRRLSKDIIEEMGKIPVPNIADAMGRFRIMDPGIKSMTINETVVGTAVTVMARPADNLMIHKALEIAEPGDIIVVNTGGNSKNAGWGGLMTRSAIELKIYGAIIDGAIRDVKEINELGFPIFARTVVASGCDKDGPGEINCSIACGGVVVNPGDIIVASEDGIAVVPLEDAAEVLEKAKKIREMEAKRIEQIKNGIALKPEINEILKSKGIF